MKAVALRIAGLNAESAEGLLAVPPLHRAAAFAIGFLLMVLDFYRQ